MPELVLVLHNIRSVHNVGSILRTAECAGVKRVYVCGTTPTPIDRFGRKRTDLAKVTLGAEEEVAWEHHTTTEEVVATLRTEGFCIVALEQDVSSIPYTAYQLKAPTALILGEEVHGIPHDLLSLCDRVVEIPMRGKKNH